VHQVSIFGPLGLPELIVLLVLLVGLGAVVVGVIAFAVVMAKRRKALPPPAGPR
jgi:hypothetical protein